MFKVAKGISYFIGGALALGSLLTVINNSIAVLNQQWSIISTGIILLIWMTTAVAITLFKPSWGIGKNYQRLTKLNFQSHLFFMGMIMVVWIPNIILVKSEKFEEFVCNRDIHTGCDLNFRRPAPRKELILATYERGYEPEVSSYRIRSHIKILAGNETNYYSLPVDSLLWKKVAKDSTSHKIDSDTINFPQIKNVSEVVSPYQLFADSIKLKFFGQVFDYKSGELLGWFDENEFGVVQSCSFSWNKDCSGFEIIDKYGNVCFSIDLFPKKELIVFKGFFKRFGKFYIFNNEIHVTEDLADAEKLIKQIKPLFDHYGKNSTGKRIKI